MESDSRTQIKADRYNEGKLKWSLVDWESLKEMVKVFEMGCKKYSRDNWKKGLNREEILESMQRHLTALFNNEEEDKESGLHHMGHIMCNAVFYLFHKRNNSFTNNGEAGDQQQSAKLIN